MTALMAKALGWGLIFFSAPACFAPRYFGRQVGLAVPDAPNGSVAARDVMMGAWIVAAANDPARLRPLLLARVVSDGTDALGVAIAMAQGGDNTRLRGLGLLALGATVYDFLLVLLVRPKR